MYKMTLKELQDKLLEAESEFEQLKKKVKSGKVSHMSAGMKAGILSNIMSNLRNEIKKHKEAVND